MMITIVPGSQELDDVMLIPIAREDQPVGRSDWRAALGVAPKDTGHAGCAPT